MHLLKNKSGSRGFTLLELIVVLAILVGLAGLAVAKLDLLQLKAEKASAGMDMRNISRLIQTFRATTNFYPDRWDSLVHVSGASRTMKIPGAPGTNDAGLDPGIVGDGTSGKLTLMSAALTADQARSLSRLGITTVYDHDATNTIPYGDKFITPNTLDGGADDVLVTINPNTSSGRKIIGSIYPTPPTTVDPNPIPTVPGDRVLVVLGLGKWTTIVGSNLQSAVISEPPTYPYSNELYYNRYLAVFEAYNSGGRCRLVAVLGADGDLAADELAEFSKN